MFGKMKFVKELCILLVIFGTRDAESVTPPPPAIRNSNDGLDITSNVTQIQPSVTSDLDIGCYVNLGQSQNNYSSVMSLILLEQIGGQGIFEELASINAFDQKPHVHKATGGKVHGWLRSGDSGTRGYLGLSWDYPGSAQSGKYLCEANFLDQVGHSVKVSVGLEVGLVQTGAHDLEDAVRSLRAELENVTNTVTSQRWEIESLERKQKSLEDKLVRDHLFNKTYVSVGGKWLYFSTAGYYSFDTAQAMCTLIGGKLAEVTPNDLKPHIDRLKRHSPGGYAWLGLAQINGTIVFPSTHQPAGLTVTSPTEPEPFCFLMGPDITTFYTTVCSRTVAIHALCSTDHYL